MIKRFLNKLNRKDLVYFLIVLIIVLSTIVFGFLFLLSPEVQGTRNDSIRIDDFSKIEVAVRDYFSMHGSFPKSIQDLEKFSYGRLFNKDTGKSIFVDPKTKNYYDLIYSGDGDNFKLCANFEVGSKVRLRCPYTYDKGYSCIDYSIGYIHQGVLDNEGIKPQDSNSIQEDRPQY